MAHGVDCGFERKGSNDSRVPIFFVQGFVKRFLLSDWNLVNICFAVVNLFVICWKYKPHAIFNNEWEVKSKKIAQNKHAL